MLQQNHSVIDKSFMWKLWSAFKKFEREEGLQRRLRIR